MNGAAEEAEYDVTCMYCEVDLSVPLSMQGTVAECPSCKRKIMLGRPRLQDKVTAAKQKPRAPQTSVASMSVASQPVISQSQVVAAFVTQEFDEFNNTTTIKHINTLRGNDTNASTRSYSWIRSYILGLIKTSEESQLVFGVCIEQSSGETVTGGASLTFNCDQVNHRILFTANTTEAFFAPGATHLTYSSTGLFHLSQEILAAICNAGVLKIREVTPAGTHEPDPVRCAAFQQYCRQFYNNVYDPSLYRDAVVVAREQVGRGSLMGGNGSILGEMWQYALGAILVIGLLLYMLWNLWNILTT